MSCASASLTLAQLISMCCAMPRMLMSKIFVSLVHDYLEACRPCGHAALQLFYTQPGVVVHAPVGVTVPFYAKDISSQTNGVVSLVT